MRIAEYRKLVDDVKHWPRHARNSAILKKLTKRATGSGRQPAQDVATFETTIGGRLEGDADHVKMVHVLAGWLRSAIEIVISGDFSPASVREATQLVTDQFRRAYGTQPKHADITDAIRVANTKGDLKIFRPGDLERAASFLLENIKARIGAKLKSPAYVIKPNIEKRSYWQRVRAMAAAGPRQVQRSPAEVVARTLRRYNLSNPDFSMKPKRGYGITETVRASVGLAPNVKHEMMDIVRPSMDRLGKATKENLAPLIKDATRGVMAERGVSINMDRNPAIRVEQRGQQVIYKIGSVQFHSYEDAERYLQAISNNADMLPPQRVP